MSEAPETVQIDPIESLTSGWDVRVDSNFEKLANMIRTFVFLLETQGNTGTPSVVRIQAKDIAGDDLIPTAQDPPFLRIRVCDGAGGYVQLPNATIGTFNFGTLVEDQDAGGTPNTDIVATPGFDSGIPTWEFEITNATAETFTVRVGPPPFSASSASYLGSQEITHA